MEDFKFKWTDDVRKSMLEKKQNFGYLKDYEYGFYDGFKKAIEQTKANKMLEMLNHILFQVFWNGSNLNLKDKENIEKLIKEATEL